MKKTLPILLILLLATGHNLFAARVNMPTAQQVALNFYKANAPQAARDNSPTAEWAYTQVEQDNTIEFYVFNISPAHGFVVVAADDNVTPVIGYSLQTSFNASIEKSGIKEWMGHASAKIYYAVQQNVQADEKIRNQWTNYTQGNLSSASAKSNTKAVAPLLNTTWGQETFYNQYCPFNTADNQRTLTGCVATAMAQIMKFWNYPAQGTGSYSYSNSPPVYVRNYGNLAVNFGATTYNWQAMPAALTAPNADVATLMYHCGVAVSMDYGDNKEGGSGAYVLQSEVASWKHTAEYAYKNYFNYNGTTLTGVYQADYSAADWMNMMKAELDAQRPIQYEGQDPIAGGHTWVCDGYDANNMLHMNWGWDGENDGYFDVSNLTSGRYNFSTSEAALIGIKPAVEAPVVISTAKPAICLGDSAVIGVQNADNVNSTYLWSPATGLSSIHGSSVIANPTSTTVYTVLRDSNGIKGTSTITITVNAVQVTGTVTDVNCFGSHNGAINISATTQNGSLSYLWNNGGQVQSPSGLFSGTYAVTVSNTSSCSATASFFVAQPDELKVSIQASVASYGKVYGDVVVNVTGGTKDFSYLWNNGETGPSLNDLSIGNYVVTVTDAKGCQQSAATVIHDQATGINDIDNQAAFDVYPNPAQQQITIRLNDLKGETLVSLKNALGQTLLTQNVSSLQSNINLGNFADGIYFVQLKQTDKTSVKQVMVRR